MNESNETTVFISDTPEYKAADAYATAKPFNPYAEYTSAFDNAAHQMHRAFLAGIRWERERKARGKRTRSKS